MLALIVLACAMPVGLAEDEANLKQDVLVLFTSDVHCGVDENFGYAGLQAVRDTLGGVIGEGYENPYGQERIVAVGEPADEADATGAKAALPEGVVPVTWEVTPEHPMIDTDEARALYQQILAGDYPTMEELLANPVVQ